MRIASLSTSISRAAGGIAPAVLGLNRALSEHGVDITTHAALDADAAEGLPEWDGMQTALHPVRALGPVHQLRGLADELKTTRPDIVHLHGLWLHPSMVAKRYPGTDGVKAKVISPHGMLDRWALQNSAWKKRMALWIFERANLESADCLHALNASEAASIRALGLTKPIAVIPNGVELPQIGPRCGREGRKTLLFLGRIHPKKGLGELVGAWARACESDSDLARDWQLRIAGWDDGGHLAALREQIATLEMGESVSLLGPAFGADKDRLLRSADAFILPSHSEGLPMSVLEAWAYRLPVMMTAACNLPEGFTSGAAVEIATNRSALAESLVANLRDATFAGRGEAGRMLVEHRFTWPRIASLHVEVFEWLVKGGPRPACVSGTGP